MLAVLLVIAVVFLTSFRDALSLDSLAASETQLRQFQQDHPVLVLGAAFLVYVAVTGLSLPGATAMTLVYAWLFGFPTTVVLVSFASTSGATVAFLLSRYVAGAAIQTAYGDRLARFNEALRREGAFYLFTLRLIPVVPFFVINVVMGLTQMRVRTFWWVSQLGMLPGTCVYVYAGASAPTLAELAEQGAAGLLKPQLLVAFVLLGIFPLAVKRVVNLVRPARS